MKKQLLSTSAIALGVAMASPVAAQEWDLEWGGFVNTHIGASDVSGSGVGDDEDFDGVNVFTNSEIIFRPSVTLDNGLTFGAVVEYEALNGGGGQDGIDESFAYMESDMLGRIEAGSHNSAGYLLSKGAPTVGSMAINSPSISAFVPFVDGLSFRSAELSPFTEVGGNNDVQRLTYFTPSFNGLVAGVSYAPNGDVNAGNSAPVNFNEVGGLDDIFDIGVAYDQSFGGVDLGLSARWGTGDREGGTTDPDFQIDPTDGTIDDEGSVAVEAGDPTTWAIGATLGVNGFTFGGSYAENDQDTSNDVGNSEGWSLGASYDIAGPWTVGLETYQGEVKTSGNDTTYETYKLGANRDLGAGVSWDVYYAYVESKNDDDGKIEGNVIATAINLSF